MGRNKYAILKQVIDLYEDYEQNEKHLDLLSFARWITNKLDKEPELNKRVAPEKNYDAFADEIPVIKKFEEKTRFLESVSRLARYHEFYSRKALKDLVINTRLEFLFLQTINLMEKAKKTDLINTYHLEYTTGMDTIRRLNNNGLLDEIPDDSDKRAKLLVLTQKGHEILALANKRMDEENKMFLTAVNQNKWKKAMQILEEIDEFHSNVYQNHNDKPFAELCNLMDSLKYLYK
ncbi:DNA-binding transcriptional regulator, MarR family [Mariniphaga anaerophila]|uniref:DNA-binding transcriptional regulator, MarR family n=1 Tax=Mariniphaga anaerophila TaxID=1484053 RepID=A0A1M4YL43_9BACT|nr:MarR family winged helix-turn-helix transcriptional regulator [Mariniphaga anaerophila]SHF06126.1 DNA-binding transcriptional regulator, MarR family [Mariniphaga anaerophila]